MLRAGLSQRRKNFFSYPTKGALESARAGIVAEVREQTINLVRKAPDSNSSVLFREQGVSLRTFAGASRSIEITLSS